MNKFLDRMVEAHQQYQIFADRGLISVSREHVHLEHEAFLDLFASVKVEYEYLDDYCLSAMYRGVKFITLVPTDWIEGIKEDKQVDDADFENRKAEKGYHECNMDRLTRLDEEIQRNVENDQLLRKEVDAFWNDVEAGIKEEV